MIAELLKWQREVKERGLGVRKRRDLRSFKMLVDKWNCHLLLGAWTYFIKDSIA